MKFKKLLATACSFLLAATSFLSGGSARAEDEAYDELCKICFLGDAESGKTQLCNRFAHNGYNEGYKATIGLELYTKMSGFNKKKVKLQMWDTAGNKRFRVTVSSFFCDAYVILLHIDLTKDIEPQYNRWVKEVNPYVGKDENGELKAKLVLIGTKCDSVDDNKTQQFTSFAKEKGLNYFITSAKSGYVGNENQIDIGMDGFGRALVAIHLGVYRPDDFNQDDFNQDDFNQDDSSWSTGKKIAVGAGAGVVTVGGILATVFGVKHDQNKKENKTKVPKAQVQQKSQVAVTA